VFNPGGPGGSGIEFLQTAALIMPPEIADRFDLVSFDPRGVGASTAVDCAIDLDDEITLLEPGDDAGWDAVVADAEANAARCTDDTTRMSPYFGTNNAARDLDQLREALGDDRLSYVGFSYGTRLGATYAELFPDRVRALVLDGAVKPTTDFAELNLEQGPSFDRAFDQFAQVCDSDADCALQELGATQDVYSALVDRVAQLGSLPTTDDGRILTPGELELGTIAALYSTQLWPVLSQGIRDATVDQDGTLLQVLVDTYAGRRPDGSYDNSQAAGSAINCADDAVRPDTDVVRSQSEEAASLTTWFDGFLRASTGCIGAPPPVDPLIIGPAEGAPPILVIGNTGDPATPYEWSVAMADYLASAELFTVEAEGHTAFLTIPCVDRIVIDYLVDLVMPETGSSCAADAPVDVFQPAGEGEFDKVLALFDCLRDNGADIPEVSLGDLLADPTGESLFEGIDPTDPSFVVAAAACQELIGDL
jgi:pimeloyl-ACP methyl ester carboxylesterase